MNNLIAIDTSTHACSVAVAKNGQVVATRKVVDSRAHSQQLLGMIRSALDEATCHLMEMDAVVCAIGPGAFTGVRIGIGVAKGLAFGQDLPIIPVSSLMATALTAAPLLAPNTELLVMNDARMSELYWARYRIDEAGRLIAQSEQLSSLEAVPLSEVDALAGTGITEYMDTMSVSSASRFVRTDDGDICQFSHAACMIDGIFERRFEPCVTSADALRPNYLRNKVV